ncbi:MAG: hypothetical protein EOP09_19465, partial [Proteobacteria bacterium]
MFLMANYKVSDRWLWLSFILSVVLLLASQWFAHQGSESVLRTLERGSFLRAGTHDLARLISAVKDAETGQRGFLLTHRASYLEPYYRGVKDLRLLMEGMRKDYASDPSLTAGLLKLEPVLQKKTAEMERSIVLAQTNDFAGAMALVESGEGKNLMDEIRAITDELLEAQMTRISATNSENARNVERSSFILIFSSMAAIAIATFAFGSAQIQNRRRRFLEMELRQSN